MLDECQPATDYIIGRTSIYHERPMPKRTREPRMRECCKCGRKFYVNGMAHVGEETYECAWCLGVAR